MNDKDAFKLLKRLYNNLSQPYGLSHPEKLYKNAKEYGISRKQTIAFIRGEPSFTLHTLKRMNFPRRKIIASGPRRILAGKIPFSYMWFVNK